MAGEKANYELGVEESPAYNHKDAANIVAAKGNHIGEAADIYGDVQTAEEYGYVTRGCVIISDTLTSYQCH
jgi:amino acid transporter